MEAKALKKLSEKYHENKEFITNEESTKMALIIPFLRLLGFDSTKPKEFRVEYSATFTEKDGKKLSDRMDFALFDKTGKNPLFVVEAKPLGCDVEKRSPQLARYLSQLRGLRFGIITNGCDYLFFADLDEPNRMDAEPFFKFSFADIKTDFVHVAEFLSKFSKESFEPTRLVTEAEDSRYREGMIDKLENALKDPDESFVKWLSKDVYTGHFRGSAKKRLTAVAKDAIEPAIMRVIGEGFLNKLRNQMYAVQNGEVENPTDITDENKDEENKSNQIDSRIKTTDEEIELFNIVKDILKREEVDTDRIYYKDTINYINISFDRKTKYFVRYFGNTANKNITTLIKVEAAKKINPSFKINESPIGTARIYIDNVSQVWALKDIIIESFKQLLKNAEKTFSSLLLLPEDD